MPNQNALLKCLEIEWQDHFQTRQQTWKALQIVIALAGALIGIDWQLKNTLATTAAALLLIIAAQFGIWITMRHRNKTERQKFTHIINLEKKLGVIKPGLIQNVKVPEKITWFDAFRIWKSSTSLFILRMHLLIQAFGIIYLIFTWTYSL